MFHMYTQSPWIQLVRKTLFMSLLSNRKTNNWWRKPQIWAPWAFCWNLGESCCKKWSQTYSFCSACCCCCFFFLLRVPPMDLVFYWVKYVIGLSEVRRRGYRQSCWSLPFRLCPAWGQEGTWDSSPIPPPLAKPRRGGFFLMCTKEANG